MLGHTFCPLGDAAAMPTISYVKNFAMNSRRGWPQAGAEDRDRLVVL